MMGLDLLDLGWRLEAGRTEELIVLMPFKSYWPAILIGFTASQKSARQVPYCRDLPILLLSPIRTLAVNLVRCISSSGDSRLCIGSVSQIVVTFYSNMVPEKLRYLAKREGTVYDPPVVGYTVYIVQDSAEL